MGIRYEKVICPFCNRGLILKFILEKETMSRFYAYCKDCKCSIIKTIRRKEEQEYIYRRQKGY